MWCTVYATTVMQHYMQLLCAFSYFSYKDINFMLPIEDHTLAGYVVDEYICSILICLYSFVNWYPYKHGLDTYFVVAVSATDLNVLYS